MKKSIWIPITIISILLIMSTKKAFAKIVTEQDIRDCDPLGCGTFGASRGEKVHQGIDIVTEPGDSIFSPISGTVTRLPFPYKDDLSYKGVEIKNSKYTVKIFYVVAVVKVGTAINAGTKIAIAQDISAKYDNKMTNHAHIEVRETQTGKLLDPTKLF